MPISQIRLVDGSYKMGSGELCLVFEKSIGSPALQDGIILFETVWRICELTISETDAKQTLIAKSHIHILNNLDVEINDLRGKDIVCGFSWETYKSASSQEKIEYFKAFVDLYPFIPISEFIRKHIQLTIAIFPINDASTAGLSKLGGLPTGPTNFSYPKDKDGLSTLFIGQIHLEEFNQWFESTRQLAGQGMLYFFGSIRNTDNTYYSFDEIYVRYSAKTNYLIEIPLPDSIKDYGVFEQKNILAAEEIIVPPLYSTLVDQQKWNNETLSLYQKFEEVIESYNILDPPESDYYDCLKLLGYPDPVQQCVQRETLLKHLRQGLYNPDKSQHQTALEMTPTPISDILEWRHLFSFRPELFRKLSTFKGEFNKYVDGVVYVMVKESDLKQMNFDNTETVYQST
jgi:uncharacterized protein YwqG